MTLRNEDVNSFHHPESHLERATTLLNDSRPEYLAYAALEFRYAVEGRLLEYSEHAETFRKNPFSKWRVKDLAKHIDGVFSTRGAVYTVEMHSPKFSSPIVIKYIPVPARVLKIVGQTDNYLHAAGVVQLRERSKQDAVRALLTEGVAHMRHSLSGALQGPLVRDPDGHVRMVIDAEKHPELQSAIQRGDEVAMRIEIGPLLDETTA